MDLWCEKSCIELRKPIWSESVGIRTRPVGLKPNKSVLVSVLHAVTLVLVLQVWCCVVKHGLVTLVIIIILKDTATATFQVLFIVSQFCAWNITTVEMNSGVYLLKVISAKCLCLTSGGFDLGLVSSGLGLALGLVVMVSWS